MQATFDEEMRRMRTAWMLLAVGCAQEGAISSFVPELSVLPGAIDFGDVVVGTTTGPSALFVSNSGRVDLLATLSIVGADADAFSLGGPLDLRIPPDGVATVPVSFAPAELRAHDAALSVAWNHPDAPAKSVSLQGVGRVPFAPEIEVDPITLDLGTVALGNEGSGLVSIRNVGDADLVLGTLRQGGAGTFALADDPSGATIAPHESRAVVVVYTPLVDTGDAGSLSVPSNDADEAVVEVTFLANGGGASTYPEAIVDCPGTVDLADPVLVHLDGTGSFDPDGGTLTFLWSVTRRPAGASPLAEPIPTDEAETDVLVDAAGLWEVTLQVHSEAGVPSVPAKCVLDVVPVDALHVELSWAGPTSDLDLHLADGDAALFDVPGDVSWCNPTPDWGLPSQGGDDPILSLDDAEGFGPEHVGITAPVAGEYAVRVHAFEDGDDGAVTATVQVFAGGALVFAGSEVLERNEVWEVGSVHWPAGTVAVDGSAPWDAAGLRGCP